jgi:ABC-type sugar transport system ATPase subunit
MDKENNLILKIEEIYKHYGGVKALNNVSFDVRYGEVHGLVGENGAGKSTLIKILGGIIQRDRGRIVYKGEKIEFDNPHDSQNKAIAVIHQEPAMLPHLSIMENIYMGRIPKRFGLVKWAELEKNTKKVLDMVGLDRDPTVLVKNLNTSHRQLVDIAKALSINANLVIMDEPNSSLTELETRRLFEVIRKLKEKNVSVVYVSHKIEEVLEIADRISVLRDGNYIGTIDKEDATIDKIINMMVGRELKREVTKKGEIEEGDILLEVRNLTGNGFRNVSFTVRKGEIVGFTGLVGAGRSETVRSIYGADEYSRGEIYLGGKPVKFKSEQEAIKNGLAMLPEDRMLQSIFSEMKILHNISMSQLPWISKLGIIINRKEEEIANRFVDRLAIKLSSLHERITSLSGGNQQKTILARWLATQPKLLILDEPTHGIDVGAKAEIYSIIRGIAKDGIGIILISSELPEIIALSHSVVVMHEGKITGIFKKSEVNQDKLMAYATGILDDFK